jgi:hypothetical protein
MSKEPTVKPGAKKPAAKKAAAKPGAKKPTAEAAARPPTRKPGTLKPRFPTTVPVRRRGDSVARLLECAGLLSEEEAEDLRAAVRRAREED